MVAKRFKSTFLFFWVVLQFKKNISLSVMSCQLAQVQRPRTLIESVQLQYIIPKIHIYIYIYMYNYIHTYDIYIYIYIYI